MNLTKEDIHGYLASLSNMLELHSRAIACHCECLGMNAENALAVCSDSAPPYGDGAYHLVMQKWGLTDERGKPTI